MNQSDPSGDAPPAWVCEVLGAALCAAVTAGGLGLGGSNIIPTGLNLDTNVLIDVFKGPYEHLLNKMLNIGTAPVVSPQALFKYKGSKAPIMNYLVAHNGWESPNADPAQVAELQLIARTMGRSLGDGDARILSSALQDDEQNGLQDVVLTGDQQFYKFMVAAGLPTRWWSAHRPAPGTASLTGYDVTCNDTASVLA